MTLWRRRYPGPNGRDYVGPDGRRRQVDEPDTVPGQRRSVGLCAFADVASKTIPMSAKQAARSGNPARLRPVLGQSGPGMGAQARQRAHRAGDKPARRAGQGRRRAAQECPRRTRRRRAPDRRAPVHVRLPGRRRHPRAGREPGRTGSETAQAPQRRARSTAKRRTTTWPHRSSCSAIPSASSLSACPRSLNPRSSMTQTNAENLVCHRADPADAGGDVRRFGVPPPARRHLGGTGAAHRSPAARPRRRPRAPVRASLLHPRPGLSARTASVRSLR